MSIPAYVTLQFPVFPYEVDYCWVTNYSVYCYDPHHIDDNDFYWFATNGDDGGNASAQCQKFKPNSNIATDVR